MTLRTPRAAASEPPEAIGWAWSGSARNGAARPAARRTAVRSAAARLAGGGRAGIGGARIGTALLVGLGVGLPVALLAGLLAFVAILPRSERPLVGGAEGIVALTGGAERIGDAIDLLAAGYGQRLLITGVNERTSREEIARLNPGQRHWIACCVDLDYRARNTIGNAIETRRWMRAHRFASVAVVTASYHMPRTLIELDHALRGDDRIVPHPVIPEGFDAARWWQSPPTARLVVSEYVKFVAAWVRTRFEADPERSRAAILIGRGKPVKVVAEPLMWRLD